MKQRFQKLRLRREVAACRLCLFYPCAPKKLWNAPSQKCASARGQGLGAVRLTADTLGQGAQ